MSSNYKKLGNYIQLVNRRNTDLKVETLLGVSIQKILMPSIANTVGTNMKTYKIIKKNQFAYGPVTSRNGDKISIALLQDFDEAIISQAYTVFEVIDTKKLHPEYLMMWFRRPEFDRYARFKSHGSARETFDWEEMCEVELPIPSIEKQREIVKEYNTVTNLIKLNEQLNQKLEETAQALYKHWFVDFEFPNDEGKPYKSSGGAMVYNEELDKEIPEGWEVGVTEDCSDVLFGYSFDSKLFSENNQEFPLVRIRDIVPNKAETFTSEKAEEKYFIEQKDLLIGMDGKFHCCIWFGVKSYLNQRVARLRENTDISIYKIFFSIKEELLALEDSIFGTTVSHLSNGNVRNLKVLKTPLENKYKVITDEILNYQISLFTQNTKLEQLKELLLAKMTQAAPTAQAV